VYRSAAVRRLRSLLVLLIIPTLAISSGCVAVHAHQRENLAKRSMTNDKDVGEIRFRTHQQSAREGADGGTGQPGGGCGCN
jgi:hypothetical protein